MSDANTPETGPGPDSSGGFTAPIRIMGQFIKDFSFEVPHAPEIFALLRQQSPELPVSLDTSVRQLEGTSTFEVTLSLHIEAMLAGRKAFILELDYASVIEMNTQVVPQEHVHPMLMIEVPRQMFPYVRQIVTEVTVNGGFPPLILQMFDFAALYSKKFGPGPAAAPADSAPQAPVH